ncbi:para-aminobenzoate synthase PabaA [Penicillium verhagenii]|nr:para-aminobenzoate synthase PabaA [Penicillium verhagenii]
MDMKKVSSGSIDSPFWGGFLGYFSYELGLSCLPHPKESTQISTPCNSSSNGSNVDDPPDVSLLWCERSIVVDNETGNIVVQSTRTSDDSTSSWLDEAFQLLKGQSTSQDNTEESDLEFLDSILHHVSESDRVVFPWKFIRRLLKKYNPARYSGFANLGPVKIVSSSPECFLDWDRVSTLEDETHERHVPTTLQRCLPPGSMTGAPKERSCMHLKTIEGRGRGVYSGIMGYLDLGGGGSFAVMIRMAFTCSSDQDKEQIWRIGAGGAITTLSTPRVNGREMLTKLRTVGNIFAPFDAR